MMDVFVVLGSDCRILGNLYKALMDLQRMHQHFPKHMAGDVSDAVVPVAASLVHLSVFVLASLRVPALPDPHIALPKSQAQF